MKKHFAILTSAMFFMCSAAGCASNNIKDETAASIPDDEKGKVIIQSGNQDENVPVQVKDFNKTFNIHNRYTGETEYSYQIDEVEISLKESSDRYKIILSYTGKKTFDSKGADAQRRIKSEVRILDEDGDVIDSCSLYSGMLLREGDTFEHTEFEENHMYVNADGSTYTIELYNENDDTAEPVKADGISPDPARYYCPYAVPAIHESGAELPFDIDSEWVDQFRLKNLHITDNGILIGLFDENYKLADAEYEGESVSAEAGTYDMYCRPTRTYDINNPEDYLKGVPDEAMPSVIRINVIPDGDIIVGQRRCLAVSFCYQHNKDDDGSYAALMFQYYPGNVLTESEWEEVVKNADKNDVELSQN